MRIYGEHRAYRLGPIRVNRSGLRFRCSCSCYGCQSGKRHCHSASCGN